MRVILQNILSPEKHIDKIFGDIFMMLRNLLTAFYFLEKDMMRKIIKLIIIPKLEYAEVLWSPHKKKHALILERIQKITTKTVPELKDSLCEEKLKEMQLNTNASGRESEKLTAVYELINNLEETVR